MGYYVFNPFTRKHDFTNDVAGSSFASLWASHASFQSITASTVNFQSLAISHISTASIEATGFCNFASIQVSTGSFSSIIVEHINLTGGKIAFPATQSASSDANTLDDYEEGTFVVGVTCGSGTVTLNNDYKTLSYTKIGRVVHIAGILFVDSVSSPDGTITIGNLPFPINASTTQSVGFSLYGYQFQATMTGLKGRILSNYAMELCTRYDGSTGDAEDIKATTTMYISATYST